jgi:putative sterol carrier protein
MSTVKQRLALFLMRCADDKIERHVAGRMYLKFLPFALRRKFRAEDAEIEGEDLAVVYEMKISTRDRVLLLEIEIAHRRCTIRHSPTREPDAAMGMRLADLIRMSSGAVDGPGLMTAGRMTFSGDAFMLARFPGLFGLTTRSVLQ